MGLAERTNIRRKKMVAARSASHEEAEQWDLDFWQNMTPQDRLSALVAIRRDTDKVVAGREAALQNTMEDRGD